MNSNKKAIPLLSKKNPLLNLIYQRIKITFNLRTSDQSKYFFLGGATHLHNELRGKINRGARNHTLKISLTHSGKQFAFISVVPGKIDNLLAKRS